MGPNRNGDPHPIPIRREPTSLPARQEVNGKQTPCRHDLSHSAATG